MLVGRVMDWNTEVRVEQGFFKTHIYLMDREKEVHIELDKYKLEELIKLLNKCKN